MSECANPRRRVIRPKRSAKKGNNNSQSVEKKQLSLLKRAAKKLNVSNVYNRIAPTVQRGSFLPNSPGNKRTYKGRIWKLVIVPNSKFIRVLKPGLNASLPLWLLNNNNKMGQKTKNYIENLKRNGSNSNVMELAANKANKAANVIQKKYKSYKKKKSPSKTKPIPKMRRK